MDKPPPVCVASTGEQFCQPLQSKPSSSLTPTTSNFFRSGQWSPDGTCILTDSEDNVLRSFVLPADLLSTPKLHHLTPYSSLPSGEPFYAAAPYPYFSLANPSTTLVLSSIRDHPIRLSNALNFSSGIWASYPLVSPTTEKYITPHGLAFASSGTHFVTGSDSLIAVFDVTRNGEGPVERHPTIPSKRKKIVGGGVGMKGIVSSLDISSEGILAAGSLTRCIGLYANEGRGDCIAVFSVAEEEDARIEIDGAGVTQAKWSPCGRYLHVAERKSDSVQVYDIRVTGKRLGILRGRCARTNQRMGIDFVQTAAGYEVWAGGTDGKARIWSNPAMTEGASDPTYMWKAHEEPVSSVAMHPSGAVAATCSGQRHLGDDRSSLNYGSGSSRQSASLDIPNLTPAVPYDNTLKIWSIQDQDFIKDTTAGNRSS